MPANAGLANSFNIGKDAIFSIIGPYGVVTLPITTGTYQQITDQITSRPLNQRPIFAAIPAGWSGSFSFDRTSSVADDLFAQMENDYWTGGVLYQFSVTETITETNLSVSQYRFNGMAIRLDDGGNFAGNAAVAMKISFMASERKKVF